MSEVITRLFSALADRYHIEREIGSGGMATVYLARDLKHDRDVALKVLRPELAALLGIDRFLNEIRISARLDHPHILTLIDSGVANGVPYYVLPFVRGESLRDRLKREKRLAVDEALDITTNLNRCLTEQSASCRRTIVQSPSSNAPGTQCDVAASPVDRHHRQHFALARCEIAGCRGDEPSG